MQNDNQKIILKKLLYIYSKYLNKKKHLYFLKYHTIAAKLSYLCTCKCSCIYPSLIKEYDSISLYKDSFQKNVGINFIDQDTTYNTKNTFSHDSSNANIKQDFFYVNRDKTQNKSAYYNYINLNKSRYYVNGNEIGNISSFKINNFNNSMYINNRSKKNSKDKNYIVKIKSSNNKSIPIYYNKIYSDNENNKSIIDYSNNIPNKNKKILSEKGRLKHYSYKNIRIQRKLNNAQKVLKSNYCNHKDFIDPINGIIADKISDISKELPNKNKERNTKLIDLDQQILEYLNQNNHEKENIIKKMKSQKVQYNKINTNPNANNKDKIINLNNLNNYSYINNNYNYYCSDSNNGNNKSSIFNPTHKYAYKNLNYSYNNNNNYNYNLPYLEKRKNKNIIYSNFLKKRVKRFENKKYPLKMNYANENINLENILYEDPINDNNNNEEVDKNMESCRTSKNLMKIDYSNKNYYDNNKEIFPSCRYKIPIVVSKKSLSPSNITGKSDRHTVDNINHKRGNNNIFTDHYDTDRTPSSNISLKECQSMKKMYKNKRYKNKINKSQKVNKNIIQKSLNLFFSNENVNTIDDKLLSNNYKIDVRENKKNTQKNNDKKSKIGKIPNGINHKKYKSFNPNSSKNPKLNNKTNSNNSKILKVSSKVINEQFNKDKIEKKEASNSEKETESNMRFSVQSMNDSKMMEMANKYIADEELNREEIMEILNSKKENNKEEK